MSLATHCELIAVGERGLHNTLGENNCFLNSVLQILYHLRDFREGVIKAAYENDNVEMEVTTSNNRINALGVLRSVAWLFQRYDDRNDMLLDPREIREQLAKILPNFAMGSLEDAHECFDSMLTILHEAIGSPKGQHDGPPVGVCHQFFGIHLKSAALCDCGKTNRIETINSFYTTLYAANLISDESFKSHVFSSDMPITCDFCKNKITVNKSLFGDMPTMLTVNVSWSTNICERNSLRRFLSKIPVQWDLKESTLSPARQQPATLSGIVFYYGLHYVSTFFNTEKGVWVIFDDSSVCSFYVPFFFFLIFFYKFYFLNNQQQNPTA